MKQSSINEYLEENRLDGILLTKPDNLSWYFEGEIDPQIDRDIDKGFFFLLITMDKVVVQCQIEDKEFLSEKFYGLNLQFHTYLWNENPFEVVKKMIPESFKIETDSLELIIDKIASPLGKSFYHKRTVLTEKEINRLRTLGKLSESILYEFSSELHPEMPEIEIEKVLRALYIETGIETPVLFVGSDSSISRYRNCFSCSKGIKKYIMISLVTKRMGLHVSLTRFFHFGRPPAYIEEEYLKASTLFSALAIEAISVSRLGELHSKAEDLYNRFDSGIELFKNPFGRIIGYSTTDFPIAPDSGVPILKPMAMSINATLPYARSEDTFIIHPDGNTEFVTFWEDFPKKKIRIDGYRVQRPWILEL